MGGAADLDEVIVNGKVDDLHVLVAGKAELPGIAPEQFDQLMESLRSEYDLILLDLPPIDDGFKSILFQRAVDGVALVSDPHTKVRETRAVLRILKESGVELVGIILNRVRRTLPRWLDRLF